MYQHTLVIGGTGMLRAASVALASRSRMVTSIARTELSLGALNSSLPASSGAHYMLALDWNEPDDFLHAVQAHLTQNQLPDLVVAWIHDHELAIRFAASLAESEPRCHFFHVVGSAAADPLRIATFLNGRVPSSNVVYHQVILGYVHAEEGTRWLTNEEISAGVLDAIARAEPKHVVGTTQSWASRP